MRLYQISTRRSSLGIGIGIRKEKMVLEHLWFAICWCSGAVHYTKPRSRGMQGWQGWLVKCGHSCQAGPEPRAKAGAQDELHQPRALAGSDETLGNWALPKRMGAHPPVINEGLWLWLASSMRQRDKHSERIGWGWGVMWGLCQTLNPWEVFPNFHNIWDFSNLHLSLKTLSLIHLRAFHIAKWPWLHESLLSSICVTSSNLFFPNEYIEIEKGYTSLQLELRSPLNSHFIQILTSWRWDMLAAAA